MSTTPEQKAMILDLWRGLREGRGMEADVPNRVRWNWPSLSDDEVAEVMASYQRRVLMPKKDERRPSPKHHIRAELGARKYTEVFENTRAAKVFVDAMLKDEPVRWERHDLLTAKGGVLRVQCEELEQIMEFENEGDDWQMPESMKRQLTAFLRGKWENRSKDLPVDDHQVSGENARKRPPGSSGRHAARDGMVTLASICDRRGWEPRIVRAVMRKLSWEKPEGGWSWDAKAAVGVEKKLEGLVR